MPLVLLLLLLLTVASTLLLLLVDSEHTAPVAQNPSPATFSTLVARLERVDDQNCETVLALPNLHRLLEHELNRSNPQLLLLAQLIAQHPHLHPLHLPANASLTLDSPLSYNLSAPLYVLQLHCHFNGLQSAQQWIPILIYPTAASESYLIIRVQPFDLNACTLPHCVTSKVSFSQLRAMPLVELHCLLLKTQAGTHQACRCDHAFLH
ncbi:unnamed protein product [Gongylonema pulchrum]|uniref:Secreted protein n=1 Tax=Gongylonema pulchrum TaxID=637853 RepID=A0A183DGQ7_9BILA|nr:unnamed protein product [Gongylonema pulchrum]